jgi:hypothetical protein
MTYEEPRSKPWIHCHKVPCEHSGHAIILLTHLLINAVGLKMVLPHAEIGRDAFLSNDSARRPVVADMERSIQPQRVEQAWPAPDVYSHERQSHRNLAEREAMYQTYQSVC